ncbi:MAG: helix-turn-helix transcriptional regulator [Clostridia bacterium]|nr:helix-turn-helix transcriptional regulator [Clostridia bacterium]
MELKNKLKELRSSHHMTQESVAEYLGVSSQTVSKWERGILSPDISLLPKIALLFKCSIDSLFDMELRWSIEHRCEFTAIIHDLHAKKDWDGIYRAWIREIELNPDHYGNYMDVMLHVLRKKLYKKEYVEKMLSLADHAEKCCTNDDIRNEVYRIMLQICAESEDKKIKEKGKYYYNKLPQLRHSREIYAKFVMSGDEYQSQVKKNIIRLIDMAECSVRQLIQTEMTLEEQLFYYQKAASLYEIVLDGKYAGFYDPPLLFNYYEIAVIYMKLGEKEQAANYVNRILKILEKHTNNSEKKNNSKLLCYTTLQNSVSTAQACKNILHNMLKNSELEQFQAEISSTLNKLNEYYSFSQED